MSVELVCQQCQRLYYRRPSEAKKSRACTAACMRLLVTNFVRCATCDLRFVRQKSKDGRSQSGLNFCSTACRAKAQRIGGIKGVIPAHYGTAESGYRRLALRTHGSKCKDCGYSANARMLDVHHADGDRKNNVMSNLEVLCVWCHAMTTRGVPKDEWTVRSYRPVPKPKRKGGRTLVDPYALALLLMDGHNMLSAARHLGVSHTAVDKAIDRLGFKISELRNGITTSCAQYMPAAKLPQEWKVELQKPDSPNEYGPVLRLASAF